MDKRIPIKGTMLQIGKISPRTTPSGLEARTTFGANAVKRKINKNILILNKEYHFTAFS